MDIKNFKYLLFILVIYFVIATAVQYGDANFCLLITAFLLLSFFYKPEGREIYLMSFLANVVFGCVMIGVFQQRGSFFDVGGDDSKFYHHFVDTKGNDFFLNSRYGNYIYLGRTYVKFLGYFGLNQIYPLLVYPLNWFIGANVCVCAYYLARRFEIDKIRANYVACLLAIYPFFIFYEVKILRDIFAALLLILFILIYTSKWKLILKLMGLLVLIVICAKVRSEYILYMILYGVIDLFFNLYYSNRRYQAFILAFVGMSILALSYNTLIELTGREAEDIDNLAGAYQHLRDDNNSGSLGAKLKNMGPIFSPLIVLYMWLTPFPPPIFHQQDAYTLIISIGVIFWYIAYFKMPFFISNIYQKRISEVKRRRVSKILVYILVCSTVISVISADARHLIPFYPLMFIVYELLRQEFPTNKKNFMKSLIVFGIATIILVYVVLKFF